MSNKCRKLFLKNYVCVFDWSAKNDKFFAFKFLWNNSGTLKIKQWVKWSVGNYFWKNYVSICD